MRDTARRSSIKLIIRSTCRPTTSSGLRRLCAPIFLAWLWSSCAYPFSSVTGVFSSCDAIERNWLRSSRARRDSRYSRALSIARADRRASSSANDKSCSLNRRPDSAATRVIAPSVRPLASSGTIIAERMPTS